jgi:hypothetical protein
MLFVKMSPLFPGEDTVCTRCVQAVVLAIIDGGVDVMMSIVVAAIDRV